MFVTLALASWILSYIEGLLAQLFPPRDRQVLKKARGIHNKATAYVLKWEDVHASLRGRSARLLRLV